ncbi:carboxymuconolactone decarboxylase family protein [bacterium]|nr:carboxymuconolactone decarboxylase family protein [bacterium]
MGNSAKEFYENIRGDQQKMKKEAPGIVRAFGSMYQQIMKEEGELSLKEKELIALGISIALRCVPCINLHVKGCLDAGASRAEVIEAAGVAVTMQGGPGYTYLPLVLEALKGE